MNIEEVILSCHEQILKDNGFTADTGLELEINMKNGIDSMGIVELVLGIEEALGIELDKVLTEIRQCKTFRDLLGIVEREYEVQNQ